MTVSLLTRKERYLLAAAGEEVDRPPVWIMRQAGRYDPGYLAMRERYSFQDLCRIPEACAAVSLLPLQKLDIDVLIVFNDILTPLEAMGLQVDFPDSGPVITNPPRRADDLERFRVADFPTPPVAVNIRQIRMHSGDDIPIIGFAGAPFTLVSYAVEGKMSKNQQHIKQMLFAEPALLHEILQRVTDTAVNYLVAQVEQGGADGVQIFESQCPVLAAGEYETFAAAYQRQLISRFKVTCPGVPVTLYARGSAAVLKSMAECGADVISIDWTHTLAQARSVAPDVAIQGNLDPSVLQVPSAVGHAVKEMVRGFDWRRGYIANLGHGITPQANVEGAKAFVDAIRALQHQ